jgi:hypothetical protein
VRPVPVLLALAALVSAPAPLHLAQGASAPALLPTLMAQAVPEGQREMSREEGMALHRWAKAYLLEIGEEEAGGEILPSSLERLRAMYFLSVEDRDWARRAEDLLQSLDGRQASGPRDRVTLEAYRGALEVVRAKHARWPPTKLAHLREGMGILDRMVEEEPDNLEARYLRLVSCYYLPFFLKREDSVREDFRVLVGSLPHHPEAFSTAVYRGVVRFVLDNGDLSAAERDLLQQVIESLGEPRP